MYFRKSMRILFICILLTLSNNLLSQTTKQIDYFKTLTLNISDLQDYMINLNFNFNGTKVDELGDVYTWTYGRNQQNPNRAECFYRLYENKDKTKSISFQSQIKGDYLRFKSIIKAKGLVFKRTENKEGSLIEYYSNSKFEARIYTYLNVNITSYEMNLEPL